MAVQNRVDNTTVPLITSGYSFVRNGDIAQDAHRTTALLYGTVMAQIAATGLWTPFVAVNGVDGSAIPRGIYLGDEIAAADLVAGNVEDVPILVGGVCTVNESEVVFDDGTLSAASVIGAASIHAVTARMALQQASGIFMELSVDISEFEN
jgi:hypothetical protein